MITATELERRNFFRAFLSRAQLRGCVMVIRVEVGKLLTGLENVKGQLPCGRFQKVFIAATMSRN